MATNTLLVEDDLITQVIVEKLLKMTGFSEEIQIANNGKEALDCFKNKRFGEQLQLILLDINMPVKNGWEFLDEFEVTYCRLYPTIKVVMLSSTVDPADFEKAKKYKCVANFIRKPLSEKDISSLAETIVD